jgi:hypothetical protein
MRSGCDLLEDVRRRHNVAPRPLRAVTAADMLDLGQLQIVAQEVLDQAGAPVTGIDDAAPTQMVRLCDPRAGGGRRYPPQGRDHQTILPVRCPRWRPW